MRYTIALVACLVATSAHADNLTCKRWLELGHHRYLGHGYAEPMAAAGGEIKGTMDTLNTIRAVMARHAQRSVPEVHNLQELWDAVMTACEHEPDKPMAEVLAAVREAVIELQLALDRAAAK